MGRKANITVVLLASSVVGAAVGFYAGLTGASAIVGVAVLPPLILFGLGELRAFRIQTVRGGSTVASIVVPAGAGLLALGLIVGMLAGLAYEPEGHDLEPRELAAPKSIPEGHDLEPRELAATKSIPEGHDLEPRELAATKSIPEGRDLEPRELAAPDDYRRGSPDACRYVKTLELQQFCDKINWLGLSRFDKL